MPAARIVPAFDEVEDGKARLYLGAEPLAIEQLALEGREEALAQGVVVRVADAAHRRPDASLATPLAERDRRVLAALVGVMNDVLRLTPCRPAPRISRATRLRPMWIPRAANSA